MSAVILNQHGGMGSVFFDVKCEDAQDGWSKGAAVIGLHAWGGVLITSLCYRSGDMLIRIGLQLLTCPPPPAAAALRARRQ